MIDSIWCTLINLKNKFNEGIKRKDDADIKKDKAESKRHRKTLTTTPPPTSTEVLKCASCNEIGHRPARSKKCRDYNYTLKKVMQMKLGNYHTRYTLSIPFNEFCQDDTDKENALLKIKKKKYILSLV
ncbi:uncharacterized protein BX663DRAFT_496419, partial [Cokeromyces recurvatus]|uniref:uncharacterized protein n=1 Tax=Cokeromyces recurvatus TaxID=90255 RepID=UPI00221F0AC5